MESTAAIFQSLSVAAMGWVDGAKVLDDYRTMARCYNRGDQAYRFYVSPLWMVFGVELWFRTVFQNQGVQPDPPSGEAAEPLHSA